MELDPRLNWRYAGVGLHPPSSSACCCCTRCVNGFPFLFPDFWGYSGACPDEMRSPVLGCAMRPVHLDRRQLGLCRRSSARRPPSRSSCSGRGS
ncbi:MAG: hypothetical protein MZV70_18925 [Desulfobacterales bacterium]|nr:hypothetical protein [Desulfobacterales bacterium]